MAQGDALRIGQVRGEVGETRAGMHLADRALRRVALDHQLPGGDIHRRQRIDSHTDRLLEPGPAPRLRPADSAVGEHGIPEEYAGGFGAADDACGGHDEAAIHSRQALRRANTRRNFGHRAGRHVDSDDDAGFAPVHAIGRCQAVGADVCGVVVVDHDEAGCLQTCRHDAE